ncbi:hypothetical protein FACS1894199_14870 [Bacteroidia bacterium]|nr:hypothetical protein FACS1894199_14870 [Bacteroidia bacterium]
MEEELFGNGVGVREKCNVVMPEFVVPDGYMTLEESRRLCHEMIRKIYEDDTI